MSERQCHAGVHFSKREGNGLQDFALELWDGCQAKSVPRNCIALALDGGSHSHRETPV